MRKFLVVSGVLVLALSLLAGCKGRQPKEAPSKVLAEVNGKKITEADFNAMLEGKPDFYKQYAESESGRKQILDSLVERELLLQTAMKEGVDKSPDIEAKVQEYRTRIITEKLREKVTSQQVEVTDEEIKNYYDSHPEQFNPEEQVRLKQIVLNDAKTANQVLKEVKASPNKFSELARQYSQDEMTKVRGGELGFKKKGDLPPELAGKVFALKENEISPVLSYKGKFYIFQALQRKAGEHKEFDNEKDKIKRRLEYEKKQSAWREYLDNLKKTAQIKYME